MIRTRDFLLFLVTLTFLLIGIGATVWHDVREDVGPRDTTDVVSIAAPPTTSPEVIIAADDLNRETELAAMREKVTARREGATPEADMPEVALEDDVTPATTTDATTTVTGAVNRCVTYSSNDVAWPTQTVSIDEREGVTIVVYEEAQTTISTTTASTSQQTFWQLPVPQLAAESSCIDHAIVGVAFDGLPLRNDEASLYAVFGAETLVGYARDGFPIYGTNDAVELDECGGIMTPQGYRYYLSSERESALGCFSGTPAPLPSEYGNTGV